MRKEGSMWSCNKEIWKVNHKLVHLTDRTIDDLQSEFDVLKGWFPEGMTNLERLADQPKTVILPQHGSKMVTKQPELYARVKAPLIVTCRADVRDPNLITNMEWIKPEGFKIGRRERILTQDVSEEVENGGAPRSQLIFYSVNESDCGTHKCKATYADSGVLSASVKLIPVDSINWMEVPIE
jgi:hypothetical protein